MLYHTAEHFNRPTPRIGKPRIFTASRIVAHSYETRGGLLQAELCHCSHPSECTPLKHSLLLRLSANAASATLNSTDYNLLLA
jgi:hypothetical protein